MMITPVNLEVPTHLTGQSVLLPLLVIVHAEKNALIFTAIYVLLVENIAYTRLGPRRERNI